MASIELSGVRQRYNGRVVLDLPTFTVGAGSQIAIVGHNGSGKSTLLRLLALLERPTEGRVLVDGRVTLVEQRPVLLRGTVRDNIAYGLRARGATAADIREGVATAAERLGVAALLDRTRRDLSEGEVQRVAVARALAVRPDVLLLDEPTSSADRAAALALFAALQDERRQRGVTICLASHQLEDAYRWADDIRTLAEGRLSPATPENLFRVELPSGPRDALKHVRLGGVTIALLTERSGPAILAIPPEDIVVSAAPLTSSARNEFHGRITRSAQHKGGTVHLTADVGIELVAAVTPDAVADLNLVPGASVVFAFKAASVRVF